jgi:hypothetical protein
MQGFQKIILLKKQVFEDNYISTAEMLYKNNKIVIQINNII